MALTADCGYVQEDSKDEEDEWSRIAIMADEHGAYSLKTSYGIMAMHHEVHAPVIPSLACRRIIHENIENRLGVVKIIDTSLEFSLEKERATRKKKKVEKDSITEVFNKLARTKKEPKVEPKDEPHEPKEERSSDKSSSSEGNNESDEVSGSTDADSEEEDPNPPPPGPPAPPPVPNPEPHFTPTPGHVHLWLTRTGRRAQCKGCRNPIDPHTFRMLYHPDPQLNPDWRVWQRSWLVLYIF